MNFVKIRLRQKLLLRVSVVRLVLTNLQNKLWTTAKEWATAADVEIYKKISEFNPFADKSCSWFDPWWMFGVKDGFDIVIGNPPYINVENINPILKEHLFENYKTCKGRTDVYLAFIEKSLHLLKAEGNFTFIIPYPFTNQKYGLLSRKMLIDNYWIREILDTSDYYVFENANVKTIILSVNNSHNRNNTIIKKVKSNENFEEKTFNEFTLNQELFLKLKDFRFETKDISNFVNLKNIICEFSIKLEEICLIAYGARLNHKTESIGKDFFIHSEYKKGYKPFTEGKNIEKFYFNQYGWLNYQPDLHYNSMFTELFENDKIMFINVVKDRLRFAYDDKHYYNSHTVINCVKWDLIKASNHTTVKRNITQNRINNGKIIDYKYLLGILNSNLINWYFVNFLSESLHFYPEDAKELPIKKISKHFQTSFIIIVDYLLFLHNQENIQIFQHTSNERIASHLEDILNMMVYELYFEEHMKEIDLDVLQFVTPVIENLQNLPIEQQIKELYEWYQKPENAVRQRMMLIDTRSPDILAVIHKSI